MIAEPHVRSFWRVAVISTVLSGGLMVGRALGQSQDQSSPPSPSPSTAPTEIFRRVHVSSGVAQKLLVTRLNPLYSKELRKKRIQGMVSLRVLVSKDGDVVDVKPISGHPALVEIATDAVKQWKYRPYMTQGEAVEMETDVKINFTLAGG